MVDMVLVSSGTSFLVIATHDIEEEVRVECPNEEVVDGTIRELINKGYHTRDMDVRKIETTYYNVSSAVDMFCPTCPDRNAPEGYCNACPKSSDKQRVLQDFNKRSRE